MAGHVYKWNEVQVNEETGVGLNGYEQDELAVSVETKLSKLIPLQ